MKWDYFENFGGVLPRVAGEFYFQGFICPVEFNTLLDRTFLRRHFFLRRLFLFYLISEFSLGFFRTDCIRKFNFNLRLFLKRKEISKYDCKTFCKQYFLYEHQFLTQKIENIWFSFVYCFFLLPSSITNKNNTSYLLASKFENYIICILSSHAILSSFLLCVIYIIISIAGLIRARSARGTEPRTHRRWSTSFRLVVTGLTERTRLQIVRVG